MQIPFVIYIEFQSNLKKVRQPDRDNLMHSIPMIIKSILLIVMVAKLCTLMKDLVNQYKCINVKIPVYRFIEKMLVELSILMNLRSFRNMNKYIKNLPWVKKMKGISEKLINVI